MLQRSLEKAEENLSAKAEAKEVLQKNVKYSLHKCNAYIYRLLSPLYICGRPTGLLHLGVYFISFFFRTPVKMEVE